MPIKQCYKNWSKFLQMQISLKMGMSPRIWRRLLDHCTQVNKGAMLGNPLIFWGKMYSIFHKPTTTDHKGSLVNKLVGTMDQFGLYIKPYNKTNKNMKHTIWDYMNQGVSNFYKTVYHHEMNCLQCLYCANRSFNEETDFQLPRDKHNLPRHVRYLWYFKNKFPNGIPLASQVTIEPHIWGLSFAAKHAALAGINEEDFASMAREAFKKRQRGVNRLMASQITVQIKDKQFNL